MRNDHGCRRLRDHSTRLRLPLRADAAASSRQSINPTCEDEINTDELVHFECAVSLRRLDCHYTLQHIRRSSLCIKNRAYMRHGTTFQTNIGHDSYARRFVICSILLHIQFSFERLTTALSRTSFLLFAYATFVLGILRMFSLRVQTTPGSGDEQVSPSRAILGKQSCSSPLSRWNS